MKFRDKIKSKVKTIKQQPTKVIQANPIHSFDESHIEVEFINYDAKTQLSEIKLIGKWRQGFGYDEKGELRKLMLNCKWFRRTQSDIGEIKNNSNLYQLNLNDVGTILQVQCIPQAQGLEYEGMPFIKTVGPIDLDAQTDNECRQLYQSQKAAFSIVFSEISLERIVEEESEITVGKMSVISNRKLEIYGRKGNSNNVGNYELIYSEELFVGEIRESNSHSNYPQVVIVDENGKLVSLLLNENNDFVSVEFQSSRVRDVFCLLMKKIQEQRMKQNLINNNNNCTKSQLLYDQKYEQKTQSRQSPYEEIQAGEEFQQSPQQSMHIQKQQKESQQQESKNYQVKSQLNTNLNLQEAIRENQQNNELVKQDLQQPVIVAVDQSIQQIDDSIVDAKDDIKAKTQGINQLVQQQARQTQQQVNKEDTKIIYQQSETQSMNQLNQIVQQVNQVVQQQLTEEIDQIKQQIKQQVFQQVQQQQTNKQREQQQNREQNIQQLQLTEPIQSINANSQQQSQGNELHKKVVELQQIESKQEIQKEGELLTDKQKSGNVVIDEQSNRQRCQLGEQKENDIMEISQQSNMIVITQGSSIVQSTIIACENEPQATINTSIEQNYQGIQNINHPLDQTQEINKVNVPNQIVVDRNNDSVEENIETEKVKQQVIIQQQSQLQSYPQQTQLKLQSQKQQQLNINLSLQHPVERQQLSNYQSLSIEVRQLLQKQMRPKLQQQLKLQISRVLKQTLKQQVTSELKSSLDQQIRTQLERKLKTQLQSKLRIQLQPKLSNQIHSKLTPIITSKLQHQLKPQIIQSLSPKMQSQIQHQIKQQIQPKIKKELHQKLKKQLQPKVKHQLQPKVKQQLQPKVKQQLQPKVRIQLQKKLRQEIKPIIKKDVQLKIRKQLHEQLEPEVKVSLKKQLTKQIQQLLKKQLRQQVKQQLKPQVKQQLKHQLRVEAKQQLKDQLKQQVKQQLRQKLRLELREQIKLQLRQQLRKQLKYELRDEVKQQVKQQIRPLVKQQLYQFKLKQLNYQKNIVSIKIQTKPKQQQLKVDPQEVIYYKNQHKLLTIANTQLQIKVKQMTSKITMLQQEIKQYHPSENKQSKYHQIEGRKFECGSSDPSEKQKQRKNKNDEQHHQKQPHKSSNVKQHHSAFFTDTSNTSLHSKLTPYQQLEQQLNKSIREIQQLTIKNNLLMTQKQVLQQELMKYKVELEQLEAQKKHLQKKYDSLYTQLHSTTSNMASTISHSINQQLSNSIKLINQTQSPISSPTKSKRDYNIFKSFSSHKQDAAQPEYSIAFSNKKSFTEQNGEQQSACVGSSEFQKMSQAIINHYTIEQQLNTTKKQLAQFQEENSTLRSIIQKQKKTSIPLISSTSSSKQLKLQIIELKKLANRLTQQLTQKNQVIDNMKIINKEINSRLVEITKQFHLHKLLQNQKLTLTDTQSMIELSPKK